MMLRSSGGKEMTRVTQQAKTPFVRPWGLVLFLHTKVFSHSHKHLLQIPPTPHQWTAGATLGQELYLRSHAPSLFPAIPCCFYIKPCNPAPATTEAVMIAPVYHCLLWASPRAFQSNHYWTITSPWVILLSVLQKRALGLLKTSVQCHTAYPTSSCSCWIRAWVSVPTSLLTLALLLRLYSLFQNTSENLFPFQPDKSSVNWEKASLTHLKD